MVLSKRTISALRWLMRHPRKGLALMLGAVALGATALSTALSDTAPAELALDRAERPPSLTSREWLSSENPDYRLRLVAVHPRDREELGYDASIVLFKHGLFGSSERFRGSFDWNDSSGRELAVHLLTPKEKRFIAHASVQRCNEGTFDLCLQITGLPEGPTRFFSQSKITLPPERAPKYP